MIISEAFPFKFKGKSADMRVVRNNGFCWGRILVYDCPRCDGTNSEPGDGGDCRVCDGEASAQFDVSSRFDLYWESDDYAAEVFIRKARRGGTEPVAGSPL